MRGTFNDSKAVRVELITKHSAVYCSTDQYYILLEETDPKCRERFRLEISSLVSALALEVLR